MHFTHLDDTICIPREVYMDKIIYPRTSVTRNYPTSKKGNVCIMMG